MAKVMRISAREGVTWAILSTLTSRVESPSPKGVNVYDERL